MKLRYLFLLMAMVFIGIKAKAQDNRFSFNLNYNYGFPTGMFHSDVISNSSPRGFTGNLMYQLSPKFSIGLGTGYQDYYQKFPRQLYNTGKNQQVSAVLTNTIEMIPVMARAQYFPAGTTARFEPYLALGVGGNFIDNQQYLGEFGSGVNSFGFRASAGAGVQIPLGLSRNWGIDLGGSYDLAPYHKFGDDGLNTVNVHGGVYLSLR